MRNQIYFYYLHRFCIFNTYDEPLISSYQPSSQTEFSIGSENEAPTYDPPAPRRPPHPKPLPLPFHLRHRHLSRHSSHLRLGRPAPPQSTPEARYPQQLQARPHRISRPHSGDPPRLNHISSSHRQHSPSSSRLLLRHQRRCFCSRVH